MSLAIDLKIFKRRKYILFVCGIGQAFTLLGIVSGMACEPRTFVACLALTDIFGLAVASINAALQVEQARKDIQHGQADMCTLCLIFCTIGGACGCLIAAYLTDTKRPFIAFSIMFVLMVAQAINFLTLTDEIERNPLATGKDIELLKYEKQ